MYLAEVEGRDGIRARIVAASIVNDISVYTFETRSPKFIDAELRTHRILSQNSSSSRAIPFGKLEAIYIPFDLRKNEKGMQGYEQVSLEMKNTFWEDTKDLLQHSKKVMQGFAPFVHKQHINRYLEPWMMQSKIITGTEWNNFFRLRLAENAQPEIQELARCMQEAMEQVTPRELSFDEWHLPYIREHEYGAMPYNEEEGIEIYELGVEDLIKCSVARCARVSYNTHDNLAPSVEEDMLLHSMLASQMHMTPFEHQLRPMENPYYMGACFDEWEDGITHVDRNNQFWSGNMRGWIQNRQLIQRWNT